MRQIDRDVDPAFVEARRMQRAQYRRMTAAWGSPRRCATNICDGDGSCVACGADQGESCLGRLD
jgi:hypothetical protein